jgi:hypothetical protein
MYYFNFYNIYNAFLLSFVILYIVIKNTEYTINKTAGSKQLKAEAAVFNINL